MYSQFMMHGQKNIMLHYQLVWSQHFNIHPFLKTTLFRKQYVVTMPIMA